MSYTAQSLIDKGTENKYLYNGKELQDDLGLNWLDYGFRMYDPVLARWHVIDPMIENHYDYTPYAYVYNNPMRFIDPFGLDTSIVVVNEDDPNAVEPGEIDEVVVTPDDNNNDDSDDDDSGLGWKKDDGEGKWNWKIPYGIRFTWELGQGQARKVDSYESGGDIGDLMSLLTGGVAMSYEKAYTGITSIFKWLDFFSDGFISGNNANPIKKKTESVMENTLEKRIEVSNKPIPHLTPIDDSITIKLQDGSSVIRPRYVTPNGDTIIDRDPKSKRSIR